MLGHGTKFGRKKEQAIVALLSQRTLEEAARAIDIVPNTLLRWMKVPEFGTPYRTRAPSSSAEAYWARCRLHEQPLQVSFETAGRQWLVPSSARILSRGLTSDAI